MRVDDLVLFLVIEGIFVCNDFSLFLLLMVFFLIVRNHALWVWVLHKSISASSLSSN